MNRNIQTDYVQRVHRVFIFIEENLDADLSLQLVSEKANFSSFHFHRVFKMITGETLNSYITRKRVEKSASDLIHKNISVTDISQKYGFNDTSTFSRTFKKYYGVSPTEFRTQNPNKFSKIRQLKSKNGQEYPSTEQYFCIINNLKNWTNMNTKIEIKEMPKMEVVYISSVGSQNLGNAYAKLLRWATPKGLIDNHTKMITVYYDSFKITAADKVRMSAGMILKEPVEITGEIAQMSIEPGKVIMARYEIGVHEFEKSWTGLFIWMNENGYTKAERNPFEIYHNDFNKHPEKKCIVDFCIPIQ